MIPGKRPEDDHQRDAMLRRLGIAEERPPIPSRWDVLARDFDPTPPVQTPPPVDEPAVEAPAAAPERGPILMTEAPVAAPRMPEPVAEPAAPEPAFVEPVAVEAAPEPAPQAEPASAGASFMPGWGEESIPEDEEPEVEAYFEEEGVVEIEAAAEPELEPEPEPAIEEIEAAPTAEVIFIDQMVAPAPAVEEPVEVDDEEPELTADAEADQDAVAAALEQVRADLEAIRAYLEVAPQREVAAATPVVVEILRLSADLLSRPQPA